jgi:uncharacterized protein YvpB
MKKLIIILVVMVICATAFVTSLLLILRKIKSSDVTSVTNIGDASNITKQNPPLKIEEIKYDVYSSVGFLETFDTLENAIAVAKQLPDSFIQNGKYKVWDNFKPYHVFVNEETTYSEFTLLNEAMSFAKGYERSFIYYRKNNSLLWLGGREIRKSHKIENVPIIKQLPELERGCEVTSLAMLIKYNNSKIDKLTLANQIKKDTTTYSVTKGVVNFGNPHIGFVGNMESKKFPGLGVYNEPIFELLEMYFPNSAINLTGSNFEDLFQVLGSNSPIWVITNTTFKPLSPNQFQTWQTSIGTIDITYSEHSVLVTGYDENFIYFNDPLNDIHYAPRDSFIAAWEQMGRQAVSIVH